MTCSASFGVAYESPAFLWQRAAPIIVAYGSPAFLWQRAAPIIVGWFTGRKWKKLSISGVPNCPFL